MSGGEVAWPFFGDSKGVGEGEGSLTLMHAKDLGWGAIFQAHTVATIINKALVRSRL
jgi:hypothetical protein